MDAITEERKRGLRYMREHFNGFCTLQPEYIEAVRSGVHFDSLIGFQPQGAPMLKASTITAELTADETEQLEEANRRHGPTLNELFDRNFAIWKKEVGKATAENQRRDWDNHVRSTDLANKPGGLFTEDEARNLIVSLHLQKDGKRRIRRICGMLTKRLIRDGFRRDNPFPDIKLPKDRRTEQKLKYYDLEEFSHLVTAAEGQLFDALRVAGNTGLRPDELRWLQWGDVDLQAQKMTVCRTSNGSVKSGVPKTVDLLPGAVEAFKSMEQHASGWCFPSALGKPRNRQAEFGLRKLCAELGIEYKGLYGLRHFFAVMLATGGFGIQFTRKEAAVLMRHESMSSIDVYYTLTDDHIAKKAQECRPLELIQHTQV